MHNRRLGSLLVGGWLVGTVLVWFVTAQTLMNVDRLLSTPPVQIRKELADMGSETARTLLRHQAREVNRRVLETWEILQIGIAGALLATSIFTDHRSKTTLTAAVLLMGMASVAAFYLTPVMNELGRSSDFLPQDAGSPERALFAQMQMWHRLLDVLKLLVALILSARLLFDFYEFRDKFVPAHRSPARRRRRVPSGSSSETGSARPQDASDNR